MAVFIFSFLKNYKLFYDNNVVLLRKMTKRGIQKPSNSYLCDKQQKYYYN